MEADIVRVAQNYHKWGLSVVPVYQKRPLVKWRKWRTQRQTESEFSSLPFEKADGFAIVCGTPDKSGLYFLTVDVDTPDFNFKLLPITQIERTPRGGLHFYYLSHKNAKGDKHHARHLELLGQGNIVVVWPTAGYTRVNNNIPRELEDLKPRFEQALVTLGGHVVRRATAAPANVNLPDAARVLTSQEEREAADFLAPYWLPGYRNQLAMCYLGFCLKKGLSYESARRVIQLVTDKTRDPEKTARLELVKYHYSNRGNTQNLLGASGIRQIIEEVKNR